MPEQEKSSPGEVDPSILSGLSESEIRKLKRVQRSLKKMGQNLTLPEVALLEMEDPEDEDEAPPVFSARRNSPAREFDKRRLARRKKSSTKVSAQLEKRAKRPTPTLEDFMKQTKRLNKS